MCHLTTAHNKSDGRDGTLCTRVRPQISYKTTHAAITK